MSAINDTPEFLFWSDVIDTRSLSIILDLFETELGRETPWLNKETLALLPPLIDAHDLDIIHMVANQQLGNKDKVEQIRDYNIAKTVRRGGGIGDLSKWFKV